MLGIVFFVIDATDSEEATQVESLLFDLSTLRVATVNFSEENKLGEGGFGAVYKVHRHDTLFIFPIRYSNSLGMHPLVSS